MKEEYNTLKAAADKILSDNRVAASTEASSDAQAKKDKEDKKAREEGYNKAEAAY